MAQVSETHGMAQRGGVVESTVVLGALASPIISLGEADIVLGFEVLEDVPVLEPVPCRDPGGDEHRGQRAVHRGHRSGEISPGGPDAGDSCRGRWTG